MTESGMKLVLWAFGAALVATLLALPQPVDPWELPSLILDRKAVAEDLERSRALAADMPDGAEVERLRALWVAHGLAESRPPYSKADYDTRQADIHRAIERLERVHGRRAFAAIRARAVEDFMRVFADGAQEPDGDDQIGVVGGFVDILERYGAKYRGVVIAPMATVRALYKARWNLVHRTSATDGFSEIELQAYWGWLALHGWGVPLQERIAALDRYRKAGGANVAEAAALFTLLEGRPEEAARALQALYESKRELRLRNFALAALHAARSKASPGPP